MGGVGEGLLLGLVQGLTEFLPVSSSGHLAVMEHLLGRRVENMLAFDVVVHGATLLAVVVYFAKDLVRLVPGREPLEDDWYVDLTGGARAPYFYVLVGVSLVPLLVVYPFWGRYIEALRGEPMAIGAAFIYAGGYMIISEFAKQRRGLPGLGLGDAFLIGLAQAVALAPGVSRSGMTIATGRLSGLSTDAAFRFSFLMAIPAIAGAVVVKLPDIAGFPAVGMMIAGALGAFASGFLALAILKRLVIRLGLWIFGAYCVAMGVVTIVVRGQAIL